MSNSNNAVNGDMDKNRNNKTKNSKKTSKSNISSSNEGINAGKSKSTQSHKEQTENPTLQKKKSMSKNGNDQQDKFAGKEIGNKLKIDNEDKARHEAERRSKEIAKEAEDKARHEAERRSKEIAKNLEHLPEEERIDFDANDYKANNKLINPFSTGINLWQSYSRMWVNFYKETINNTTKLTKDLGKSMRNGFVKNT